MSVGTYISGTGHVALVIWSIAGWSFSADPSPFEVMDVSVVSGAEFAALSRGAQPDLPPSDPAGLVQPDIPETPAPPDAAPPSPPPEAAAPPAPVPAPPLETPPEAPDLSVPDTIVTDAPPDVPQTPSIVAPPPSAELGSSPRPVPRPAARVAPEIVAPPPPDATVAPQAQQAATDQSEAPVEENIDVAEETTAPEAAADQIVTEAEEPAFAPEISSRPLTRPQRTAAPAAEPAPDTTAAAAPAPGEPAIDPVAAALAAAGAVETPAPVSTRGLSGGDLTDSQKTDLRREIRSCWSVGTVSTAALNTTITVEWTMNPDGSIDGGSFDMVAFEGGSQADADVAYRIARSAIARCQTDGGRSGYSLPTNEFQEPRRLRLSFDPSEMRLR